jgi:hypothetical protein
MLDPLEINRHNYCIGCFLPFQLRTEADRVSETFSLEFLTMDKVQKLSNPKDSDFLE